MTQEERLERLLKEMHNRETFYETALLEAAEAEHAYRIGFAKEFNTRSGGAELRKQEAMEAVDELLSAREVKRATADIAKEKLLDARQALSARQSLLKVDLERKF